MDATTRTRWPKSWVPVSPGSRNDLSNIQQEKPESKRNQPRDTSNLPYDYLTPCMACHSTGVDCHLSPIGRHGQCTRWITPSSVDDKKNAMIADLTTKLQLSATMNALLPDDQYSAPQPTSRNTVHPADVDSYTQPFISSPTTRPLSTQLIGLACGR